MKNIFLSIINFYDTTNYMQENKISFNIDNIFPTQVKNAPNLILISADFGGNKNGKCRVSVGSFGLTFVM